MNLITVPFLFSTGGNDNLKTAPTFYTQEGSIVADQIEAFYPCSMDYEDRPTMNVHLKSGETFTIVHDYTEFKSRLP